MFKYTYKAFTATKIIFDCYKINAHMPVRTNAATYVISLFSFYFIVYVLFCFTKKRCKVKLFIKQLLNFLKDQFLPNHV